MQQLDKKKIEQLFKATGIAIKKLREKKGLSVNLFSFESDLQKSLISRLENGKNEPKLLSLWKIAEAFDMKLSDLIKEIEEELPENWTLTEESK